MSVSQFVVFLGMLALACACAVAAVLDWDSGHHISAAIWAVVTYSNARIAVEVRPT